MGKLWSLWDQGPIGGQESLGSSLEYYTHLWFLRALFASWWATMEESLPTILLPCSPARMSREPLKLCVSTSPFPYAASVVYFYHSDQESY